MSNGWVQSTAAFLAAAVVALWSWNTLAGLFAAPAAQYRHALAAVAILALLRWTVPGGGRRHRTGPRRA